MWCCSDAQQKKYKNVLSFYSLYRAARSQNFEVQISAQLKTILDFFFQPKVFYFRFFYSHSCFFLSKIVFSLHFFLLINLLWQNVMKRILFLSVAEMSSSGAARKRHLLTKCENCHHVVVTSQLTVLACLAHFYHTTHTSHVWIFTYAFDQPTKSTK